MIDENFVCYSEGICSASVCTNLSPEEAVAEMNRRRPSGTTHGWVVSEDKTFSDGTTPNPGPCNTEPDTRIHVLLNC